MSVDDIENYDRNTVRSRNRICGDARGYRWLDNQDQRNINESESIAHMGLAVEEERACGGKVGFPTNRRLVNDTRQFLPVFEEMNRWFDECGKELVVDYPLTCHEPWLHTGPAGLHGCMHGYIVVPVHYGCVFRLLPSPTNPQSVPACPLCSAFPPVPLFLPYATICCLFLWPTACLLPLPVLISNQDISQPRGIA